MKLTGLCLWMASAAILFGCCFARDVKDPVAADGSLQHGERKLLALPHQKIPPKRSFFRTGADSAPSPGSIVPFTKTAPNAKSVLVLKATNTQAPQDDSASIAVEMGFTVVIADDAQWTSMSTADFKTYLAIIIGDAQCSSNTALIQAAAATVNKWGPALSSEAGNIFIMGTDAEYHSPYVVGARNLIKAGITRAASKLGVTGLSISLSCYYWGNPSITTVPILSYFGKFDVTGAQPPACFDKSHIVKGFSPLLNDGELSDWACAIHEMFTSITNLKHGFQFETLAIASGAGLLGAKRFSDGSSGTPYILGSVPVPPPVAKDCSRQTLDSCDFYFQGYSASSLPPTFNIGSTTGPDHSISTLIYDRFTGKKVSTINTNAGFLYGNLPTGKPFKKGENPHSFYGNQDKVFVQVFNAPINPANYRNKCVVLPITSAQLTNGANLNPKDGVAAYKEDRRCVIFKTA